MFQNDLLAGKHVLVTGGGSGLGKSMVKRFLELGAEVTILGRRENVLQETAEEFKDLGPVFYQTCDVRNPEQVTEVIDTIEKRRPIDALVNNAAGNFISPTQMLSHRAVDAVLGIVLHGTFYCTLELGKRWIARKSGGVVLNIATTYAQSGSGYVVPSAVAKAGVVTLTKSLAAEWGKYGIRLNAVAPGPFPTEGAWERLLPSEEFGEKLKSRIPLRRYGDHVELANLASYLLSDLSGFITGDLIHIDGGESVWNAGEFNILDELSPQDWMKLAETRKKG
ncbi:SDR family oxidoreductase [Deinococcus cellulosilyticus]|uniref:2,4-dienoyl-CoA reductase n=1 Tax=Deinococcus cellulosilyticus (strain DSM 18568 / NBRC 106333 / KACC 11606 / 5516J-15) TaxID=1223518 RepID=A0A511N4K2_DEIC1|nr:SDR family oxidoreductase [Deinococcus cellulosilyticus]GEM47804.1 2,4-dienoyl-CoA reductase [Deinococcus cellulosilyticus NBRC 106333 = KACC 11606]